MNKLKFKHWLSTTTLIGLGALAAAPAWSATGAASSTSASTNASTSATSGARARYLRQIEQCRNIGEHDARANCLSEASTAYAQTQPTPPQENPMQLAANALRRCDKLPEPDHGDCVARVNGAGTVEGSVAGGGMLRTLVTREVMPVAQATTPAPTPAAPPSVVPDPLPPPAAGRTPGAQPSPPPIEPAPADVPPSPPAPKPGS